MGYKVKFKPNTEPEDVNSTQEVFGQIIADTSTKVMVLEAGEDKDGKTFFVIKATLDPKWNAKVNIFA